MSKSYTSDFDPNDYVSYDYKQLSREDVKDILKDTPIGTFLIRDSLKDIDQKVLCVKEAPNEINSYKIIQKINENGVRCYFIFGKDDLLFSSIAEILEFYSAHYLNQSPLIKPAFYHKKVIALHDFLENDEDPVDDLYFHKGEILTILDFTIYDKWWKAKNKKGQVGIIPVDYVKRIELSDSRAFDDRDDDHIELNTKNDDQVNNTSYGEESEYGGIIECPFNAKVIQDYTPSPYEDSHIALKKGQIVRVLEMKAMGKWYGELNHTKGLFPFNRVEIISE